MADDTKTKLAIPVGVETQKSSGALAIIKERGDLDKPKEQQLGAMLARLRRGGHITGSGLSMVITIDTTGSMDPYFAQLRQGIDRVVSDIYSFAPGARIGLVPYKDHDDGSVYVTFPSPLYENPADLKRFMDDPRINLGQGGGDAEALECGLYDAWQMLRSEGERTRVIVNIGDKPAHGVMDSFVVCSAGRDYRVIAKEIQTGDGHLYMVTCGKLQSTLDNYDFLAEQTGGARLDLDNIADLTKQLTAIAGASTGKLGAVEELLRSRSGGELTAGDRKLLEAVNPTHGRK